MNHVHCNPQTPQPKQRRVKLLDVCVERFPEHDARVLASLIIQGKVLVDDAPQYKAGTLVVPSVHLRIRGAPCKFVSRCVCTVQMMSEMCSRAYAACGCIHKCWRADGCCSGVPAGQV
jgi:hypothetical protein